MSLGGAGLILLAATGNLTWITPLSAGLLALMMLLTIGSHVACGESRNGVLIFRKNSL